MINIIIVLATSGKQQYFREVESQSGAYISHSKFIGPQTGIKPVENFRSNRSGRDGFEKLSSVRLIHSAK